MVGGRLLEKRNDGCSGRLINEQLPSDPFEMMRLPFGSSLSLVLAYIICSILSTRQTELTVD